MVSVNYINMYNFKLLFKFHTNSDSCSCLLIGILKVGLWNKKLEYLNKYTISKLTYSHCDDIDEILARFVGRIVLKAQVHLS